VLIQAATFGAGKNRDRQLLEQLLLHPSGRFLQRLSVTGGTANMIPVLAELSPITLRSLTLVDVANEIDLRGLGRVLPRLTYLQVHGRFAIDTLELPAVDIVRFGQLDAAGSQTIARAMWPRLAWLQLDLRGTTATLADLRAFFERTDLPALTKLTMTHAPFADELCRALVGSPIGRQLSQLDLSHSNLTDAGAQVLFDAELDHLASLDVQDTEITESGIELLDSTGGELVVAADREWDRYSVDNE
jgi:hypothetical protein